MIFCKNERRYGDDEKGMWHRAESRGNDGWMLCMWDWN